MSADRAAEWLRERAASYWRDAETARRDPDATDLWVVFLQISDELRTAADQLAALSE